MSVNILVYFFFSALLALESAEQKLPFHAKYTHNFPTNLLSPSNLHQQAMDLKDRTCPFLASFLSFHSLFILVNFLHLPIVCDEIVTYQILWYSHNVIANKKLNSQRMWTLGSWMNSWQLKSILKPLTFDVHFAIWFQERSSLWSWFCWEMMLPQE